MTFARFLFFSGACFLFAAALKYFGHFSAALALEVPAVIFLICGAVLMVHHFWEASRKR